MPFTPAHPALILPLLRPCRRWLSATGLVLGAMAPDFEYFLRLRPDGIYGHTLAGIFWLDLPLIVVFTALFHRLLKQPLVASLPSWLRRRLAPLAHESWPVRRAVSGPVLLGGIVGALSHILWDSFTHFDGFFVELWPVLGYRIPLGRAHWPLYTLLQHGGTLLGALAIAGYLRRLPPAAQTVGGPLALPQAFWRRAGLTTLLCWGIFALISAQIGFFGLGSVIVTGMSGALVGLLAAALYWPGWTAAAE